MFYRSYNNQYPLDSNLPEDVKNNILNERDRILRNVKEYIDNNLNPKKRNILNPLKENYEKVPNIPNILKELNLTKDLMLCQFQMILIFKFI